MLRHYRRLSLFAVAAVLAGCASTGSSNSEAELVQDLSPVVATIDGTSITLAEYEAQYLRTTVDTLAAANDSLAAFEDFLERYVDFRLKVADAVTAGYGERDDLKAEMRQYRGQLARPYLMERAVIEPLVRDLFEKKQELVDVSHILIRVPEGAPAADTLAAFEKLSAIVDSLANGAAFEEMAVRNSEDPSAQNPQSVGYRGRLGFFSGGRMVKPFEDRMFATPVGSTSGIFRTQFGYHMLKVNDRKPARPDVRLAHIMFQLRGRSAADSAVAQARVDSALVRLDRGELFADIAEEVSDDRNSAPRGGDLDFISFDGWLPPSLRDASFAMDTVGTVIGPVETQFGFHLVTLLDRRVQPGFEESYEDLKAELARLPRSDKAETAYARRIRDSLGVQVDSSWVYEKFGTASVDSILFALSQDTLPEAESSRQLASLSDSTYTVRDLGLFAAGYRPPNQVSGTDRLWNVLDAFLDERAIAFEVSALEARDLDFARTMREFKDGLMLFRLMEDSVWTAAASDTTALEALFDERADEYSYPDRYRIFGMASSSDSLMQSLKVRMDAGESYDAVSQAMLADTTANVRFDTTFVEGETSSIYDRAIALQPGEHTDVLSYSAGRIILVYDGIEPARKKTFDEARASVITEYQAIVEKRMIDRLRKEHNVTTYPVVLLGAFAGYRK